MNGRDEDVGGSRAGEHGEHALGKGPAGLGSAEGIRSGNAQSVR